MWDIYFTDKNFRYYLLPKYITSIEIRKLNRRLNYRLIKSVNQNIDLVYVDKRYTIIPQWCIDEL